MDPNELIKAAPQLAKGAGALAAAIPFTAIVKRMLGPAADELAEMLRDQVRLYRYERQLKCLEKAERMAQEAGFTPQAVPPKILFPLLEGASFEENEDLHTMWSALLANAASPEDAEKVRPGFIAILKQLSPDEALLLSWFYDRIGPDNSTTLSHRLNLGQLIRAYFDIGFGKVIQRNDDGTMKVEVKVLHTMRCLDGLQAVGLLRLRYESLGTEEDLYSEEKQCYSMTARGWDFVAACRPPKSKA